MDEIKILICSDYQPEKNLQKLIKEYGKESKSIFGFLNEEIKKADIAVINIEYPITDRLKGIHKFGPLLKTTKESLIPVVEAGFNLATLANNHIANYGNKGVFDTIKHCHSMGIDTVGAGINLEEARKIYYKFINGEKIAILNFAEIEFNSATKNNAGANPLDLISNLKDIEKAKSNADYVILIIHGGYDFVYHPVPEIVRLYRFYAEKGVSAIISHHSHYISAYETYMGVPIFYSLGNFVHAVKGFKYGYYLGFSVKLILNGTKISHSIIPHFFDVDSITILNPTLDQLNFLKSKTEDINSKLCNLRYLAHCFGEEVMQKEKTRYLVLLNGWHNDIFRIARKLRVQKLLNWIILIRRKKFFFIWNILRCEHHQDIIYATFNEMFNYESKGNKI